MANVFFCHSAKDRLHLSRLKERLTALAPQDMTIFLASDGQSIPGGENWVYSIESALDSTELMFTFISQNSIDSKWIYFESGYVHARKIKVIPVGFPNIDIGATPFPLGFLQGFNLHSFEQLNNIIIEINRLVGTAIPPGFTQSDYEYIFSGGNTNYFGNLTKNIEVIKLITHNISPSREVFNQILLMLSEYNVVYRTTESQITIPGLEIITRPAAGGFQFELNIDPEGLIELIPIINRIINATSSTGWPGVHIQLFFNTEVKMMTNNHKILLKLQGLDINLSDERYIGYNGCYFEVASSGKLIIVKPMNEDQAWERTANLIIKLNENKVISV